MSHATLVFAIAAALYTLPSLVAVALGRRHQWGVFAVNLTTGWTVIGWMASLRWALSKNRPRRVRRNRQRRSVATGGVGDDSVSVERVRMDESWADAAARPDLYAQWLDEGAVRRDSAPTTPPVAAKPDMPRKAFFGRKPPHPIPANRETPETKAA